MSVFFWNDRTPLIVCLPFSLCPKRRTNKRRSCHHREATPTKGCFLPAPQGRTAPPTGYHPLSVPGFARRVFTARRGASARGSGHAEGRLSFARQVPVGPSLSTTGELEKGACAIPMVMVGSSPP